MSADHIKVDRFSGISLVYGGCTPGDDAVLTDLGQDLVREDCGVLFVEDVYVLRSRSDASAILLQYSGEYMSDALRFYLVAVSGYDDYPVEIDSQNYKPTEVVLTKDLATGKRFMLPSACIRRATSEDRINMMLKFGVDSGL